jgi:hypothetical protein
MRDRLRWSARGSTMRQRSRWLPVANPLPQPRTHPPHHPDISSAHSSQVIARRAHVSTGHPQRHLMLDLRPSHLANARRPPALTRKWRGTRRPGHLGHLAYHAGVDPARLQTSTITRTNLRVGPSACRHRRMALAITLHLPGSTRTTVDLGSTSGVWTSRTSSGKAGVERAYSTAAMTWR